MDSNITLAGPGRLPMLRRVAAASCLLLLAACVTDVSPPRQTLWEAVLVGVPEHETVSGTAAAVSGDQVTVAGVAVEGLPTGTYTWRIFQGECGSPGNLLGVEGQYPDLVVSDGEGTVAADADPALGGPMVSGRRYHTDLREAGTGEPVACGDFTEQDEFAGQP